MLRPIPFIYSINQAAGIIYIELTRPSATMELARGAISVTRHSHYRPDLHLVVDCRRLAEPLELVSIRRLADIWQRLISDGSTRRWALIADREGVYGAARLFELLSGARKTQLRIVHCHREAIAWLRGDDTALSPQQEATRSNGMVMG